MGALHHRRGHPSGTLRHSRRAGGHPGIDSGEPDAFAAILELTRGGPDFSLECVGSPSVFRQAVDVLPLLGTCGLLGVVPPGTEVTFNMDLIMNGRIVRGIIEGDAIPDLFFPI